MATVTATSGDAIELAPIDPPSAAVVSNVQVGETSGPPSAPARTNLATAAILTALYLSEMLVALDTTIVATSIPVICADLHSSAGYLWIGGAFMLANAAATPVWAKLSDIWGRKPALIASVIIFAIGSVVAATSVHIGMLIAGRAVQGMAAGGIASLVSITISDIFPPRQRSLFLGLTFFVWAVAGAMGPVVGGAFSTLVSWRWNFYINLPFCGVSLTLLMLFLKVHDPRTPFTKGILAVDWFGTLSILAVTLMVLLGLDFGGAVYAWTSPKVICLIVFGLLSAALFVFSEKKLAKYPLIPLHIFNRRSTNAAFGLACCHSLVQMGTEYYLPLYFQSVHGASPLRSGVLILPLIVLTASGGGMAGLLIHRTGRYREIIWGGMVLLTLGLGLFIQLGVNTSMAVIVVIEIVQGLGAGVLFQPPLVAVQAAVRQGDTASATATLGFMRELSNTLGLVLGGVVFQNSMAARAASLKAAGLDAVQVAMFSSREAAANVERVQDLATGAQRLAVREAYSGSLKNTWIVFTAIAGVGLLVSALVEHRELSREHAETRTGVEELSKREN